jgi:hypothetical protein
MERDYRVSADIIQLNATIAQKPSRPLGKHGMALWRSIVTTYDISDSGGVEMLTQACQALDRAEELAAAIKKDGVVTKSPGTGMLREHPSVKAELANRSFVVRTMERLGLNVESLKAVGRPPAAGGWAGEDF